MSTLADLAARPRPGPLSGTWLNAGLCTLLVGAAAGAYLTVGSTASQSAAPRTAQSARGVVLSSVSASGNLQAPSSLAVNFKAGGRLVSVDAKPGQHVAAGRALGRIDPASAQLAVRSAEASLHSAEAQLKQTLAGETPQQRAQDRVALLQASLSVRTAFKKYTNCLAKHGVKLVSFRAAPGQRPSGTRQVPKSAKLQAAEKACAALRPKFAGPPGRRRVVG